MVVADVPLSVEKPIDVENKFDPVAFPKTNVVVYTFVEVTFVVVAFVAVRFPRTDDDAVIVPVAVMFDVTSPPKSVSVVVV